MLQQQLPLKSSLSEFTRPGDQVVTLSNFQQIIVAPVMLLSQLRLLIYEDGQLCHTSRFTSRRDLIFFAEAWFTLPQKERMGLDDV